MCGGGSGVGSHACPEGRPCWVDVVLLHSRKRVHGYIDGSSFSICNVGAFTSPSRWAECSPSESPFKLQCILNSPPPSLHTHNTFFIPDACAGVPNDRRVQLWHPAGVFVHGEPHGGGAVRGAGEAMLALPTAVAPLLFLCERAPKPDTQYREGEPKGSVHYLQWFLVLPPVLPRASS